MRGWLDLDSRTIDEEWPDFEEWALMTDLLEETIPEDTSKPRVEQEQTNEFLACSLAIWSIRVYTVAAAEQLRRFEQCLASGVFLVPSDPAAHRQAYVDLHFYFVCWSRIEEMVRLIEKRSGLGVSLPDEDRRELHRYKNARHHLEHYAERLPGGPRTPQPPSMAMAWGLSIDGDERRWQFGGEEWDVSARSLDVLRGIGFRFEDAILRAAQTAWSKAHPGHGPPGSS